MTEKNKNKETHLKWQQGSSEKSLFIQLWKNEIFLSLYYYHINIVNDKILSLNFFFKST